MRGLATIAVIGVVACGAGDKGESASAGSTSSTLATATDASGGSSSGGEDPTSGGDSASGGMSTTGATSSSGDPSTSTSGSSGGAETGEPGTSGSTSAGTSTGGTDGSSDTGPKLDLAVFECPPDAVCCDEEGFIPPHALLEEFYLAYPPANMPKSTPEVQAFEPVADGHMMVYSQENVGNELVDANVGGVIPENVQKGRDLSRMAAEMAVPGGAMVLEIREDPVVIEDLGGPPPCIGVGWGWGSIVFEAADKSIGELVYLYVGYCAFGDVEAFYYSDQAVELCPAPG